MKVRDRLATLSPDHLRAGRSFLAELTWRNLDSEAIEDPDAVSDAEVVLNVARQYCGGWGQFLKDYCPGDGAQTNVTGQ